MSEWKKREAEPKKQSEKNNCQSLRTWGAGPVLIGSGLLQTSKVPRASLLLFLTTLSLPDLGSPS